MTLVLPSCPFPDAHWLRHYLHADHVTIDLGEHYRKQTMRNRFVLMGSHGAYTCTVRVRGQKGRKTPLNEITLVDDTWRRDIWRSLTAGYARSPYFDDYETALHAIVMGKQQKLSDFNTVSLDFLLEQMGVPAKHHYVNHYIKPTADIKDLREDFEPSVLRTSARAYPQVFEDRYGFMPTLSGLDLVLNTGPEATLYLS